MPPDTSDADPGGHSPAPSLAFATLVTTDAYAPGALALAHALRARARAGPPPHAPFHTVALATPATLSARTQHALRRSFDRVVGVEPLGLSSLAAVAAADPRAPGLDEQEALNLALLARPDLAAQKGAPLTKLHVWRLTSYRQVVYLDADMLPLRRLDHLLTRPLSPEAVLAASPDAGWPDSFNSGLMVLRPSNDTFLSLAQYALSHPSWDGADQGLLNDFVASCGPTAWAKLPFLYNVTLGGGSSTSSGTGAGYTYLPAWTHFGHQVYAIHFIGPHKPWSELPPVRPDLHAEARTSAPLPLPPAGDLFSWTYAWWQTYVAARPDPDPLNLGPPSSARARSTTSAAVSSDGTTAQDTYTPLPLPGKSSLLPKHITTFSPHSTLTSLNAASPPSAETEAATYVVKDSTRPSLGPSADSFLTKLHDESQRPAYTASWDAGSHSPPHSGIQAPPQLARGTFPNAWDDPARDRVQIQSPRWAYRRAREEEEHRLKQERVLRELAHTPDGGHWGKYLTPRPPSPVFVSAPASAPSQTTASLLHRRTQTQPSTLPQRSDLAKPLPDRLHLTGQGAVARAGSGGETGDGERVGDGNGVQSAPRTVAVDGSSLPPATRFFPEDLLPKTIASRRGEDSLTLHLSRSSPPSQPSQPSQLSQPSQPSQPSQSSQSSPQPFALRHKFVNAWDQIPSVAALGGRETFRHRSHPQRHAAYTKRTPTTQPTQSPQTTQPMQSTPHTNSVRETHPGVQHERTNSLRNVIRQRAREANLSDPQERAQAHALARGPPTREVDRAGGGNGNDWS